MISLERVVGKIVEVSERFPPDHRDIQPLSDMLFNSEIT